MSAAYLLPPPCGYGFNLAYNSGFKTALRKIANVTNGTTPATGSSPSAQPNKNQQPRTDYSAMPTVQQHRPVTISTPKSARVKPLTREGIRDEITRKNQQKPYGFANRLSDVWSMLIDRIKLWWYQSRMRSGDMTDTDWRTVQEAATRLGKNQTARSLGAWWNPKQYDAAYFDGLSNFTKQLQNVHRLRGYGNTYNDPTTGPIAKLKAGWKARKLYGAYGKDMDSAMAWGNKYGYVNDELYNTYNQGVKNFR